MVLFCKNCWWLSWLVTEGQQSGRYSPVGSQHRPVMQLANGTLLLSAVTKEAQGRYLCAATNAIGAGLSKVITVTVQGNMFSL